MAIKNRTIKQHSTQETERRQTAQRHNATHKPKLMSNTDPIKQSFAKSK